MRPIGVILTLVVLVAIVGVGLYLFNGGIDGKFFSGKTGSNLNFNSGNANSVSEIKFGSNIDALDYESETNWHPEYTLAWAGQWMQTDPYGWQTFNGWIESISAADSTPVILWYYWGNDTTQEKIENGFGDKSVDDWKNMTSQMGDSITNIMGERGAIVVLEPEFNKYGTENYTAMNQHFIDLTNILHEKNSNIKVVIGFGNWNSEKWADFSDAVNAADMIGYQGVAKYPDQSQDDYATLVENSISASDYMQRTFPGKPIIWYDFAASSSPEPDFYFVQQQSIQSVFDNLERLEDAGTDIIMYRHFMDVVEYNTPGERHWGFVHPDGQRKPAYETWVSGISNTTQ